jgi:hypothetical protein
VGSTVASTIPAMLSKPPAQPSATASQEAFSVFAMASDHVTKYRARKSGLVGLIKVCKLTRMEGDGRGVLR